MSSVHVCMCVCVREKCLRRAAPSVGSHYGQKHVRKPGKADATGLSSGPVRALGQVPRLNISVVTPRRRMYLHSPRLYKMVVVISPRCACRTVAMDNDRGTPVCGGTTEMPMADRPNVHTESALPLSRPRPLTLVYYYYCGVGSRLEQRSP